MTTLTRLNFTVIKIDGLPLLRNLGLLRGLLILQMPYFQIFIDFGDGKPKERERQNKYSGLLGIKEIRKFFIITDTIYFCRHKHISYKSNHQMH